MRVFPMNVKFVEAGSSDGLEDEFASRHDLLSSEIRIIDESIVLQDLYDKER